MGEVYQARDTRLERSVAIKVLRDDLGAHPQRRVRFEREARAVSSLTHPNICQLFDIGSEHGTDFLVMEYLEGQPLALRLMTGPLPESQVLRVGADLASALGSAHRHNIVHRDVKPSNIMLAPSGAKLLDFGLARDVPQSQDTETLAGITQEGSLLGTLAYMAPEQIEGKQGDFRTDIWGLGTVLYEMVTGRRGFDGPSRADVMAAILTRDADLGLVRNPALRHVIGRCLAKDPDARWQSAEDIAQHLLWIGESGARSERSVLRLLSAVVAVVAISVAAVAAWGWWRESRKGPSAAMSLSIAFPFDSRMGAADCNLAISSDGKRIVFGVSRGGSVELYSRAIDHFEPSLVTSGTTPAFSPDGAWLAYTRGPLLFKSRSTGGPETLLAQLPGPSARGISWGRDGAIYFASWVGGIQRVSVDGGDARPVTIPNEAADENNHRWPHVLPDGKHLLFTIRSGQIASFDDAQIGVLSLETGRWRTVIRGGSQPTYLRTGHLVYVHRGSLMAVPFDLETLTVRGTPVAMTTGVRYYPSTGAAQYAVAEEAGTLIYVPGGALPRISKLRTVDRRGVVTREFDIPKVIDRFRVSPDLKRLALQVSAANDDIFSYDIERGTLTRVSSESGDELWPAWSHDGSAILFANQRGLYRQPIDGGSAAELLVEGAGFGSAAASPDGRLIAYTAGRASSGLEIRMFPTDGSGVFTFTRTAFDEAHPNFSPDGKWLAYVSGESGKNEAYVRSVSGSGRVQISAGGGATPMWSGDGRELFYRHDDEFYVVPVTPGSTLSFGRATLLFRLSGVRSWDVFGDEFIVLGITEAESPPTGINVLPGWFSEVKARSK
jgi:eukaryotic-like serine/threonine-protein kinase